MRSTAKCARRMKLINNTGTQNYNQCGRCGACDGGRAANSVTPAAAAALTAAGAPVPQVGSIACALQSDFNLLGRHPARHAGRPAQDVGWRDCIPLSVCPSNGSRYHTVGSTGWDQLCLPGRTIIPASPIR